MLVWILAEPVTVTPFDSMTETLPIYLSTMSAVLVFTLVAGAVIGIFGA
jgi:hypothetical protein